MLCLFHFSPFHTTQSKYVYTCLLFSVFYSTLFFRASGFLSILCIPLKPDIVPLISQPHFTISLTHFFHGSTKFLSKMRQPRLKRTLTNKYSGNQCQFSKFSCPFFSFRFVHLQLHTVQFWSHGLSHVYVARISRRWSSSQPSVSPGPLKTPFSHASSSFFSIQDRFTNAQPYGHKSTIYFSLRFRALRSIPLALAGVIARFSTKTLRRNFS